jgi:hypothetical protein
MTTALDQRLLDHLRGPRCVADLDPGMVANLADLVLASLPVPPPRWKFWLPRLDGVRRVRAAWLEIRHLAAEGVDPVEFRAALYDVLRDAWQWGPFELEDLA